MSKWKNEDEMFALMREKLYTPVVGDILDQKGYVHQFLPPDIRPLKDDMKLAGKAMTVLMIDVFGEQKKPFGYLTEALDQLQKNEIYIATGGTKRCAYWGELLTATARTRGAVGGGTQRLAQRYPAGPRTELAGVQLRLLCAGLQRAYPGRAVPLPDRNWSGNHTRRRYHLRRY